MRPSFAPRAASRQNAGTTLVELVVLLAIVAALVSLALPSYREWIADARLRGQAEALAATLNRTRSLAMRSGGRATVCKSADRLRCALAGGWEQGWIVFIDDDLDGARDGDEVTLHVEGPAPPAVTIAANRPLADYVSYTSVGHPRLVNGALQMGTFVACSPGRPPIHVVVAHSGRVRLETARERCP